MNLKKLHTKSGVQSSPLLLFRKPEFFHTFSVIQQHKNFTRNVYIFFELVDFDFPIILSRLPIMPLEP